MININNENFSTYTFLVFFLISILVFILFEVFENEEKIDNCDGYIWTRRDAIREITLENTPRELILSSSENEEIIPREPKVESAINALITLDSSKDTDILIDKTSLEELLLRSIEKGSMKIIEAINQKYKLNNYVDELNFRFNEDNEYKPEIILLRWACIHGRKEVCEWLINTLNLDENDLRDGDCLTLVCSNSNPYSLYDYLASKFKFTLGDILYLDYRPIEASIINYVSINNPRSNSIIYKLINDCNLQREDLFNDKVNIFTLACYNGGELVQMFYEDYSVKRDEATSDNFSGFKSLFTSQSLENIKWFVNTYKVTSNEINKFINYIISICNLDIFIFINSIVKLNKSNINIELLQSIIREDNSDNLSYIHMNICSLTNLGKELSKYSIENRSTKCSNYIINNLIKI